MTSLAHIWQVQTSYFKCQTLFFPFSHWMVVNLCGGIQSKMWWNPKCFCMYAKWPECAQAIRCAKQEKIEFTALVFNFSFSLSFSLVSAIILCDMTSVGTCKRIQSQIKINFYRRIQFLNSINHENLVRNVKSHVFLVKTPFAFDSSDILQRGKNVLLQWSLKTCMYRGKKMSSKKQPPFMVKGWVVLFVYVWEKEREFFQRTTINYFVCIDHNHHTTK